MVGKVLIVGSSKMGVGTYMEMGTYSGDYDIMYKQTSHLWTIYHYDVMGGKGRY